MEPIAFSRQKLVKIILSAMNNITFCIDFIKMILSSLCSYSAGLIQPIVEFIRLLLYRPFTQYF